MSEKVEVPMIEALALLNKGYTIADLKGVTPEQMEALYALGYQYYNSDDYENAGNIFKALCLFDPSDERYAMGYAACLQELKEYRRAADMYSLCCVLSGLKDPKPMYYAALCLLKAGERDNAVVALQSLEVMGREGKDAAQDQAFKEKGAQLLKVLSHDDGRGE